MGDAPKAPSFARTDVPEVAGFPRRDGKLHCEGVSLAGIALAQQTPTYVYSGAEIDAAFGAIRSAMSARRSRRGRSGPRDDRAWCVGRRGPDR